MEGFGTIYRIIPMWLAFILGVCWIVYIIYKEKIFSKIKADFQNPLFYATLAITIVLLFFTDDDNTTRSKEANKHATLAAIAAYFGHLDVWFAAFLMGGLLIYYTWNEKERKEMSIQWGMDPNIPVPEKDQHYIGQDWDKEREVL